MKYIFLLTLLLLGCNNKTDESKFLTVSNLFSDGTILQRDTTVSIWGTSKPNIQIKIISSWIKELTVKSNNKGEWQVKIQTSEAGGPHSLMIYSENERISIKDILFGEVWLAAGQSNMEMDFNYCCNTTDKAESEILNTDISEIRMFNVKKKLSYTPVDKIEGKWVKASREEITSFSAIGYFFAKNLYKELNVPIGIIHASWGGSRAEAWTSNEVFQELNKYKSSLQDKEKESKENLEIRNWLKEHKSIPLPSSDFDLFLGEYLRKVKPEMNYMSFYLDNWKALDYLGMDNIQNPNKNKNWIELDSENSIDKALSSNNFRGVALFKNILLINDTNQDFQLEIQPEKNMPWGLWEYDIYFNGTKIGSSLIDTDSNDYEFNKTLKVYKIKKEDLTNGENQIIIRTLGQTRLGEIKISENQTDEPIILGNWSVSVIAEEFFQIENYEYPYMSLFNYENKNINFSKIPPKSYLTHKTFSSLFNGMLNPMIPFTIKGAIWYQGETNVEVGGPNFENYKELMPLMISDWRSRWGSDFPFYFAQVSPYFNYQGMLPYFQNAQSSLLHTIQNTEMVVTNDIGENYDIHPSNKHDVGYRFSRFALKNEYNFDIKAGGPIYSHNKINGEKIEIYFNPDLEGLSIKPKKTTGFEISGAGKKYLKASVNIVDNYLEIFSEKIKEPLYVRYAWSDTANAILFDLEGWPASCFTTE